MFGGLHIEMAALKSIGFLLKESGWTGALVEAGLACSGSRIFPNSIKDHQDTPNPPDNSMQSLSAPESSLY